MRKILGVSYETEIDFTENERESSVFVKVYTSAFTEGLVSKIGATGFTTLVCLATFMDENGECFPSQDQIAERIGVHKNTANKYINDLLDVRINGKPIVTRNKVNKGQGRIYSYYKIHKLSQLAKFKGEVEPIDDNPKVKDIQTDESKSTTNQDVIRSSTNNNQAVKEETPKLNSNTAIKLFQEVYREVYNVNYVVSNYGREGKLMKDKVITPYPDLAPQIIRTAVTQYADKWKNAKFPRPTIGMFSWITNNIIEILEEEAKLTEVIEDSNKLEEQSEQEMLDKLNKLG